MAKTLIVGGGINGLFTAYYLHQAGHQVSIIDAGNFSDGCSFGNAGMIVPSHIIPLAQPGMIQKGIKWMFDAKSPFYVKPRLNIDLMQWGLTFWKNANEAHVQRSIPILRDLSWWSKKLFQELAQEQLFDFGWQERGLLMLYKNKHTAHEMIEEAHIANQAGVRAEILDAAQVQALESDTKVVVQGGVFYPDDAHLLPHVLVRNLAKYLREQGVSIIENEAVLRFTTTNATITGVQTTTRQMEADNVVIAGGAWSADLLKKLNVTILLQGGKGYSFTIENPTVNIQIPAIMLEARATATPMGSNLRVAGTLEIAGTDLSINMNRVEGIVQGFKQYYPDIALTMPKQEEVWSGLRPCSPDGLPYIGKAKEWENLWVATGHGMMGVSLAPATGKLIAELITAQKFTVDIAPFDLYRFK